MRSFSTLSFRVALFPLVLVLAVGCGSDEEVVTTDGESDGGTSSGEDTSGAPPAPESPADPAGGESSDSMGNAGADPTMSTSDPMSGGEPGYPGGGYPGGGSTDGTGNQAASKFPDDFAEWQPDDFRNAARATDRRCKPAIEQLVANTPGDAQTAELLFELLTLVGKSANGNADGNADGSGDDYNMPGMPMGTDCTDLGADASAAEGAPTTSGALTSNSCSGGSSEPPMPGNYDGGSSESPMPGNDNFGGEFGGTTGQNGGNARELVHAIIDGLAKNNSDQAWQALTQVLAGNIKTVVDDREMADWVLVAALDGYGGAGHPTHALLDAAIRNPESLNKARGAELRGQTAALILGTATSVMDRLMGVPIPDGSARRSNGANQPGAGPISSDYSTPGSGASPMPGGGAYTMPPDGASPMPGNDGSPMPGNYGGGNATMPGDGEYGGESAGRRPLVARRPLSDEAMRHAIQYLWRAETTSFVEERTRNIKSLEDGFETLALAGSLPTTGVRKATYDFLFSRWQDGAGPLLSGKLHQTIVRDPGMVVVLKQLPRLMKQGTLTNQQSNTANPRVGKSQRQSIAKHSWMEASAYMVRAVTDRLKEASSQQKNTTPSELPIRLHRNARVLGVYEINWPADISEFTSGVTPPGPLHLQYVRMELPQEDAARVFQSYKKQLKRGKDYKFSWGGWIDSLTAGTAEGSRRSIDVLITQNNAGNGANQNAGNGANQDGGYGATPGAGNQGGTDGAGQRQNSGSFTVEILVVEIPDPKLSDSTP